MGVRRCFSLFALLIAGTSAACGGLAADKPFTAAGGGAVVTKVVDGDTLSVRVGGRNEKVRLLGIDTPESVKPNTPVQCFAKKASARTAALLPPGTGVRLVRDVEERDRYGRLLAYVYRLDDGLFVNLDLVLGGYARPLAYAPNTSHAGDIDDAARNAREGHRGLWAECPAATSLPP